MKTAFISGHLSVNETEFAEHYQAAIDSAIKAGHNFVVGDARGADKLAQDYLASRVSRDRVTVYHAYSKPRNNSGFLTSGYHVSQSAKDRAMTLASDYDIAWVRPGRENSGTARNIERRKKYESEK